MFEIIVVFIPQASDGKILNSENLNAVNKLIYAIKTATNIFTNGLIFKYRNETMKFIPQKIKSAFQKISLKGNIELILKQKTVEIKYPRIKTQYIKMRLFVFINDCSILCTSKMAAKS